MLGFLHQVAALLFIVALPVALVTTNIRIAINEPRVYEYAADHYDTPETTGISRAETLRASKEMRAYFNSSDDEAIFIRVQKDGEPVSLFNARETSHLRDVRNLMQGSFRVQEASVIFVLAYVVTVFIWAREGSVRALATQFALSAVLGIAVIGVIGALAVTGFDQSWTAFHNVAFDNDFWRLDPDRDRLIQMFPEAFWEDMSLWIGLGTAVELAALGLAGAIYVGLTRRSTVAYTVATGAEA
jgi:integral membrane protein (TIGR01906 family)